MRRRDGELALVLAAALAAIAVAAPLRAQPPDPAKAAEAFAIRDANGIDEAQFIAINGADQWVTIRGRDRANPVILVIGGFGADGPGTVASPFITAFQGWEPFFTVVQWDMRGAGKTYIKAAAKLDPDLGVDMLVRDGLALTEELRRRLGKRRIVLLGTGFGTTVAARLAHEHPEFYSAYVANGQIADPRIVREADAVRHLRELAVAKGDQATLADLETAGPHPFADKPRVPDKVEAFRRAYARYRPRIPNLPAGTLLNTPHWTIEDVLGIGGGMTASEAKFGAAWNDGFDWAGLRGAYALPIFVIEGDFDIDAPLTLTRAWLDKVQAPLKSVTVIPGAGDHAIQTDPDAFIRVLREQVRPWAMRAN